MDPNYYVTTLTNAFLKLGPYALFLVGGYFVFIKLPFLFLKKSMDHQKKSLQEASKEPQLKLETKTAETPKVKILEDRKRPDAPKFQQKKTETNTKKEEPKKEQTRKEEPKKEEAKRPARPSIVSPEEVLGFKSGEAFTQSELKKRYFELLKQNHPDRVASMGPDFKQLAEKNTKDLNKAYDTLKKRAA